MLKAIVEKKDIDTIGFKASSFRQTILAHAEQHSPAKASFHQLNFVARSARAAIAAAKNSDRLSFGQKFVREPNHHGSLARAPNRHVPHADDNPFQPFLFEPAIHVHPRAKARDRSVYQRKRPEHNSQRARHVHRAAPPKCLAICASARCVAPRLLSTSAFAFSPILRWRSGSRNNSIHATPASSGLSTWMAAPAATNREAISAKFSIEGPNTGILPNAAGSRILCPPDGTSEPPTNAPSARRYNDASSPMLSSRITFTSSGIDPLLAVVASCPGSTIFNCERRINFRRDSWMNSAAASKRSGLRGASTNSARGNSPCTTPKAMSANGSSAATTLPATTTGARPRARASVSSHLERSVASGSAMSYLRFPLTRTRSAGAPSARMRSASFSLCIKKVLAFSSVLRRNGRKKKPNLLR